MFSKPLGNPVTLYSKCNQASDLYQHIELASELVDGGQDTMDCGGKRLVDFVSQWLVAVQPCMESQ